MTMKDGGKNVWFKCEQCGERLKGPSALRWHRVKVHGAPAYPGRDGQAQDEEHAALMERKRESERRRRQRAAAGGDAPVNTDAAPPVKTDTAADRSADKADAERRRKERERAERRRARAKEQTPGKEAVPVIFCPCCGANIAAVAIALAATRGGVS
jgi:hypothetical protein